MNIHFQKIIEVISIFLDPQLLRIKKAIQHEIRNGGEFEKLVFPIQELNELKVIQFFRTTQEHGQVSGLGSDKNLKLAYMKAFAEYFERLAYFKNIKTHNLYSTNGIAAHRIESIAKKSAESELHERDSFLKHWYSNTPFIKIHLNKKQIELNQILLKNNLEIFLCKTYLGLEETTLCFLQDKNTGGFALGLSSGRKNNDSEKSINEALINYFFGNQGLSEEQQIDLVKKEGVKTLIAHRIFWLYFNKMPTWLFSDSKNNKSQSGLISNNNEFLLLEANPFVVYQCKNDSLLDLYVGDICNYDLSILTQMGLNVVIGPTQYHPIP